MSTQPINLIGLTGYAGSGKDTVASELARIGYLQYAYAEPLKTGLVKMFDLPADTFDDREKKESEIEDIGVTARFLIRSLGNRWGRDMIADDLWIRVLRRRVRPALQAGDPVVVSDVRFDNEAEAVRQMGGVVIRVRHPEVDAAMAVKRHRHRWRRRFSRILGLVGIYLHPGVDLSEEGISDHLVDATIVNDRSLSSLVGLVRFMVDDMERRGVRGECTLYGACGDDVELRSA